MKIISVYAVRIGYHSRKSTSIILEITTWSYLKLFLLAREVARHTAALVNPAAAQKLQTSSLVRAKDEVLRLIELLCDKMPNSVSDLLGEVRTIIYMIFIYKL